MTKSSNPKYNSKTSSVSSRQTWPASYAWFSVDFYLNSSDTFAESLNAIDAKRILTGIASRSSAHSFNENILRVLCINQAVDKLSKELNVLNELKEHLLSKL